MTRREIYQRVTALLSESRSPRRLLAACEAAMRTLRDLPAPRDAAADDLLGDAAFVQVLRQDDALAQIYQAINAPALEAAYRSARRDRRKFDDADIPAVTQLFTPRWVVEFLLHNTLGRLWKRMHPDSQIALPWLVEPSTDEPVTLRRIGEIRVLDPACGTMNFGIVAVELLQQMYQEELDRAGQTSWPAEPSVRSETDIPQSIARQNLSGIDIDPVALRLASATLRLKLRDAVAATDLDLRRADSLLDPQVEHRFAGACDVVVTNPPYLSARNLPREQVQRLKRAYPAGWRDACTCFIERCMQFTRAGGRAGLLAMQSFMFIGSAQKLRERLFGTAAIETIAHFGGGLFDIGNAGTLQTAAVVLRREPDADRRARQTVVAFRAIDAKDKQALLRAGEARFRLRQDELMRSPRAAWNYWLSDGVRRAFATLPRLAKVAPPRQGLATTDNARFVRCWWEIEPTADDVPSRATPDKWFRYSKSGRFRRWYESPRHRVDWQHDGAAIKESIVARYPYLKGQWAWVAKNSSFYGREGVMWSYLTSGRFSARRLEAGSIFDVAGSSLFPEDPLTLLAILNSSSARVLLGAINPTVNFQVGDLAQLPVPSTRSDELRALAAEAIEHQQRLDSFDETTPDFVAPLPWEHAEDIWHDLHARLSAIQVRTDSEAAKLYELPRPGDVPSFQAPPLDREDLARRWIGVALRSVLRNGAVRVRPVDPRLVREVHECLSRLCGGGAEAIDRAVSGIDRCLTREFFCWHARLYERRPTIWQLGTRSAAFLVAHDRATRDVMRSIITELRGTMPAGWDRFVDDGIAVNLAPLRPWVDDRDMRKSLEKTACDFDGGRFDWSRTRAAVTSGLTRGSASVPDRPPARKAGSPGVRRARR